MAAPKNTAEIDGDDGRVARSRDKSRKARAEAEGRSRAEQERGDDSHAQAGEESNRGGSSSRARGAEHETIDAGVEVAERSKALPELVDARIVALMGSHERYMLRAATKADSSRSLSARRPNGVSARSAVWHSSAAS